MSLNLAGVVVTFQVTFTELFIAASVLASVTLRYGKVTAILGSLLGGTAIAVVAALLYVFGVTLPIKVVDWVSALLLLGFGIFLLYEFWSGADPEAADPSREVLGRRAGISIAAWGMFAEGAEIMVVWLGISLKQGAATATAGVLICIAVILLVAVLLGRMGIFRRIPTKYLDLVAGVMVLGYGVYFLAEALKT